MSKNDLTRAQIGAQLEDLEAVAAALRTMGLDPSEPGDREAYDIVARIERTARAGGKGSASHG